MILMKLKNGREVKIALHPEAAPITCANFEKLVRAGFYDGLTFHRVIPGFMVQGGCPKGNGTGGPGWSIKGEFASNGVDNPLKHVRGTVSMARSSFPDTAGSQFFIVHEDSPHLDGEYAAFGTVVSGMDAIDELAKVRTDFQDKPLAPQIIESMTVIDD